MSVGVGLRTKNSRTEERNAKMIHGMLQCNGDTEVELVDMPAEKDANCWRMAKAIISQLRRMPGRRMYGDALRL